MVNKVLAATGLLAIAVNADVYLHVPRGSNDRNCERNVNRNNGNLLYDTQNNAKGGYACPRAVAGQNANDQTEQLYYYQGSKMNVAWTQQHGAGYLNGMESNNAQLVLQYACENTLDPQQKIRAGNVVGTPRDGIPSNTDDAATDTIPTNERNQVPNNQNNVRYTVHETLEFYEDCSRRERNKGLYTADQQLTKRDARATRQNPNGGRRGLECPEERDYYPYWHPTPFTDMAVLVNDVSKCATFAAESQNAKPKGMCQVPNNLNGAAQNLYNRREWPNNKAACEAVGQTWVETKYAVGAAAANDQMAAPDCYAQAYSRPNHLGNAATDIGMKSEEAGDKLKTSNYPWTVPETAIGACTMRLRYNQSSGDFPDTLDAKFNGDNSPLKQDPYVKFGDGATDFLALAVNTNQYGRTFQDRSYTFIVKPRPAGVAANAQIYNVGVQGKRGNIVQTYPAVEYNYMPSEITVNEGDIIHFQWTGSDYNPRRGCNDGEGGPPDKPNNRGDADKNARADRSNLCEQTIPRTNTLQGKLTEATTANTFFVKNGQPDVATARKMCFLDQDTVLQQQGEKCLTQQQLNNINNANERENHPQNCAKLNAQRTPYFDAGLVTASNVGTFAMYGTRNNNLSNREQKVIITVGTQTAQDTENLAGQFTEWMPKADLMSQLDNDKIVSFAVDENLLDEQNEIDTPGKEISDNDAKYDGNLRGCVEISEEELAMQAMLGSASGMLPSIVVMALPIVAVLFA